MKKKILLQSSGFLSEGHDIQTPFRVVVSCRGNDHEIKCTRVLRNLPGKRLVCGGKINGRNIVAKFFLDSKRGKLHCRREEQGLLALAETGINTPELICSAAVDPAGQQPVLILQMLEPAIDFEKAWKSAETDWQRAGLLKNLFSLTASMHAFGLIHKDAHPGNFMVAGGILYAIDGGAVAIVKKGKALSPARSIKNLAAVFAQFESAFDYLLEDAFVFYRQKRNWTPGRSYRRYLIKQIRLQRQKKEKKYFKKIYRESTVQVCSRSWNQFMVCKRKCYTGEMKTFLRHPDAFIDKGKLLKNGNSSTVALIEMDNGFFIVKRYNIKSFTHALRRCFRVSRAWRSWKNAHRLILLNIATPKPVAMLEYKWGSLRSKAYFITEYVHGRDAYQWCHAKENSESEIQNMASKFSQILKIFYHSLITHGDFKATNFIVSGDNLVVIDLDSMRSYGRAGRKFQQKLLKDCQRLLKNWERHPFICRIFCQELEKLKFIPLSNIKLKCYEN